jgi:hypothetical protein
MVRPDFPSASVGAANATAPPTRSDDDTSGRINGADRAQPMATPGRPTRGFHGRPGIIAAGPATFRVASGPTLAAGDFRGAFSARPTFITRKLGKWRRRVWS